MVLRKLIVFLFNLLKEQHTLCIATTIYKNVWVKNVLNLLNDFMHGHLNDSLDEIAPELRVSPNFITFARAFDKEFHLCANYPKGHGGLFRQWMKVNHPGELLWHVERAASGGRQDMIYGCSCNILEQTLLH